MRAFIVLAVLVMALPAVAFDLGARAPAKPPAAHQPPPADPDVVRQGGDTMADAPMLSIPATNVTGTTNGFTDDYDEECPYPDSTSPDVVYRLAPQAGILVNIDMLGSAYDTKISVYREDMTLVACNDDYYSDYTSLIEAVALAGGVKYFLVIDGYGGDSGEYLLNIPEFVPCDISCNDGDYSGEENEPPLVDGYVDWHNGGCDTDPSNPPFQLISVVWFCGVSGWYDQDMRDTDWLLVQIPWWGFLDIFGNAEVASFMFELGPHDCGSVGVLQLVPIGPCEEGSMTIVGTPGDLVWFWVGPQSFTRPDHWDSNEYVYQIKFHINVDYAIRIESHSWSHIKSMFR